jgi:hypothetical protein
VGLFHPTDARGIPSSRAFSSSRAVTPCRRPLPSCRYLPPSASPRCPLDRGAHTLVLGSIVRDLAVDFRAFLPCRARSWMCGCYSAHPADALLDFVLSRVSPCCEDGSTLAEPPLMCFRLPFSRKRRVALHSRVLLARSQWPVLSRERLPLLRFLASSRHSSSGLADPGSPLGVAPPSPEAAPFFGSSREPCRSPS